MKNSPSRSTTDSSKKAESQLEHQERQSRLCEFIRTDAANEIDSLTQLHRQGSVIRSMAISERLEKIEEDFTEIIAKLAELHSQQIECSYYGALKPLAGSVKG